MIIFKDFNSFLKVIEELNDELRYIINDKYANKTRYNRFILNVDYYSKRIIYCRKENKHYRLELNDYYLSPVYLGYGSDILRVMGMPLHAPSAIYSILSIVIIISLNTLYLQTNILSFLLEQFSIQMDVNYKNFLEFILILITDYYLSIPFFRANKGLLRIKKRKLKYYALPIMLNYVVSSILKILYETPKKVLVKLFTTTKNVNCDKPDEIIEIKYSNKL